MKKSQIQKIIKENMHSDYILGKEIGRGSFGLVYRKR